MSINPKWHIKTHRYQYVPILKKNDTPDDNLVISVSKLDSCYEASLVETFCSFYEWEIRWEREEQSNQARDADQNENSSIHKIIDASL